MLRLIATEIFKADLCTFATEIFKADLCTFVQVCIVIVFVVWCSIISRERSVDEKTRIV